jgi:hypothetical protein
MRALKPFLAASAAIAALASGAAFASCPNTQPTCSTGGPSQVNNHQVQMNDSHAWSQLQVVTAGQVSGNAAASGNLVTVGVQNITANVRNEQHNNASNVARSELTVTSSAGAAVNGAAATGNGMSVESRNATTYTDSLQVSRWNETVSAQAVSTVRSAGVSTTSVQAAANNTAISAVGGTSRNDLLQYNASTVSARAEADVCCSDTATAGAIAAANTISVTGDRTRINQASLQDNTGSVTAVADLAVGMTRDATASAAANGNSATVATTFAPLTSNANQTNTGNIQANSWLTGGSWSGVGSSSAYATGNAHDALNTAGNLTSDVFQSNSGQVRAWSAITGGGVGGQSATLGTAIAIGNSNSATLCTGCGPGILSASNEQRNSGGVEAISRVNITGTATGASSAVATGNAASFYVGTPGH